MTDLGLFVAKTSWSVMLVLGALPCIHKLHVECDIEWASPSKASYAAIRPLPSAHCSAADKRETPHRLSTTWEAMKTETRRKLGRVTCPNPVGQTPQTPLQGRGYYQGAIYCIPIWAQEEIFREEMNEISRTRPLNPVAKVLFGILLASL